LYIFDSGGKPGHHGISSAHTTEDLANALDAIEATLRDLIKEKRVPKEILR